MVRWSILVAACLWMPAVVVAQQVVREQPVTLQLDIDRQGQVTTAKVMDPGSVMQRVHGRLVRLKPQYEPLPEVLVRAAVDVASKWRFEPINIAGHPSPGRTWATAILQIVKREDGNFGVAVRYEHNGPFQEYLVVPVYPERMEYSNKVGAFAVEYTIEPDGSADQLHVLKGFGDGAKFSGQFEQAIRESLDQSHMLPLTVDGKPAATLVRTAYTFSLAVRPQSETQLKKQVQDFFDSSAADAAIPSAPFVSGEIVATDSPFVKQN